MGECCEETLSDGEPAYSTKQTGPAYQRKENHFAPTSSIQKDASASVTVPTIAALVWFRTAQCC